MQKQKRLGRMIAVFNSSLLILLSRLNIVEYALDLFTSVNVPAYVREEVLRKQDEASETLRKLSDSNKIKIVQSKNIRMIEALCRKLERGESEAIVAASRDPLTSCYP